MELRGPCEAFAVQLCAPVSPALVDRLPGCRIVVRFAGRRGPSRRGGSRDPASGGHQRVRGTRQHRAGQPRHRGGGVSLPRTAAQPGRHRGARDALQAAYQEKGYQSVYVELPEQQVSGGVVYLQVTETTVGRVRVVGAKHYSPVELREEVPALEEGKVPDFAQVQRELAQVNRTPAARCCRWCARASGPAPWTSTCRWKTRIPGTPASA